MISQSLSFPSTHIFCHLCLHLIWHIRTLLSLDAFFLLALNLLNALFRRRQVFRHGAAQLGDGLSDLPADLIVGLIGLFLASNVLAAQLSSVCVARNRLAASSVLPM